jgi:hypothetical protein
MADARKKPILCANSFVCCDSFRKSTHDYSREVESHQVQHDAKILREAVVEQVRGGNKEPEMPAEEHLQSKAELSLSKEKRK